MQIKKLMYSITIFIYLCINYSCNKNNSCGSVTCNNGGTVVNCACDCKIGWEGPDCSNEKTPAKMYIKSIKVVEFSPLDEFGSGWDNGDAADIYVQCSKKSPTEITLYKSGIYTNADYTKYSVFTPTSPIEITEPNDRYILRLYDYDDLSADDFMDGIEFSPYIKGQNFPTTKTLQYTGSKTKFEVNYSYVW